MTALNVSVVIRTRDKETHFQRLIESLSMQTICPSEIIIVDNYSTKRKLHELSRILQKTVAKCFKEKVGLKLVPLADDDFSHAYSTNLGVNAAENELVCLTNAHSLPVSLHWLQDGLRHFENPRTAGVSGFFIVHPERASFESMNEWIYVFGQKMFLRQDWCSTVNCIIRKSLWQIYPFDENLLQIIPESKRYGLEDYDWSKEMVASGYRIVIDPAFSVFHSHEKGINDITRNVKRYFIYRRIQQKINKFTRPRKSFSKVFQAKYPKQNMEISV